MTRRGGPESPPVFPPKTAKPNFPGGSPRTARRVTRQAQSVFFLLSFLAAVLCHSSGDSSRAAILLGLVVTVLLSNTFGEARVWAGGVGGCSCCGWDDWEMWNDGQGNRSEKMKIHTQGPCIIFGHPFCQSSSCCLCSSWHGIRYNIMDVTTLSSVSSHLGPMVSES